MDDPQIGVFFLYMVLFCAVTAGSSEKKSMERQMGTAYFLCPSPTRVPRVTLMGTLSERSKQVVILLMEEIRLTR